MSKLNSALYKCIYTCILLDKNFANDFFSIYYHFNMIILRGLDIFSDVKEEKRLSTSLISTRLVKWPKANIGHCFLATKGTYMYR